MLIRARVALAGLAIVIIGQPAKAQERFKLEGRDVAIYNLVGSLRIVAGSGSATEVEVTRVGRDASTLRIQTGNIDGANALRVIYPEDEVVYPSKDGNNSNTTVRVNEDGTFGRGREGRRVRVSTASRGRGDAMEAGADIVVRIPAGTRVSAHLGVGDAEVNGVNGAVSINNSAGEITTRGTRGELKLNTASGSIDVSDAEGDLDIETASGGVQLNNTRGDRVKVDVASGSIRAEQVRAPTVDMETASGRIHVLGVESGRVKLHSASGAVEADLTGGIESADIGTASGFVNVRVPSTFDAQVEIETASGDINVDFPLKQMRQRRGYLSGTVGEGTARVSISTASGSVKLGSL